MRQICSYLGLTLQIIHSLLLPSLGTDAACTLRPSKFNEQKRTRKSKIQNTKIQIEQNILCGLSSGLKVTNLA